MIQSSNTKTNKLAAFIDKSLVPTVIRESVDPEILKRAQSIEWSICRDSGNDEHGFIDGSQGVRRLVSPAGNSSKKFVRFYDDERPDSGFGQLSASASSMQQIEYPEDSDYSKLGTGELQAQPVTNSAGSMKRHKFVSSKQPFPIYQTNRFQLEGDVAFLQDPSSKSVESKVHYEKASKVINECELRALNAEDDYFSPNIACTLDEREEETLETTELEGTTHQLKALYRAMSIDTFGYLDRGKSKSASMYALGDSVNKKETRTFASVEEMNMVDTGGDQRWELRNGKWIAVGDAQFTNDEPELERYAAERVKCTILLEPLVHEVKIEPVTIEFKRPLKAEEEEEKKIQDPNLMWMRMAPAHYGPPFGTKSKRKGRNEEWVGPPCELCHKQIEERRCMLAENRKFHCWHFSCSFCLKTLNPSDFLIAEADNKPYCLNCHKREFPEISLATLNLMDDKKTSNTLEKIVVPAAY